MRGWSGSAMPIQYRGRGARSSGLTLVELVVFIAIVSVGVAGILSVLNVSAQRSADPLIPKQALAIAEAILEEVMLAPFTYCDPDDANLLTAASPAGCATLPEAIGPEAGDSRPFDNVSDYHMTASAAVTDLAGAAVPGLADYQYRVSVAPATLNTITTASGDVLLVMVSVTGPGNTTVTLEGFRTRYAPNSPP